MLSALLTAYTTHIATDVASVLLIGVGPLSLYLLTFVLVFRERPLAYLPCVLAAAAAGSVILPWLGDMVGLEHHLAHQDRRRRAARRLSSRGPTGSRG